MTDAPASHAFHQVETAAFLAGRREDGIISVTIKRRSTVDEAASREINQAIRRLANGATPCRILVDISEPHDTLAAARRYGASREVREVTERLAIIVRSAVARMAGNAFILARRPPFPTRLFTIEPPAIDWLLSDRHV